MDEPQTSPPEKPKSRHRYGFDWPIRVSDIDIERYMIQHGGKWTEPDGREVGEGLFFHYRQLQTLIWPDDDHHDWSDLMLNNMIQERITVVQGPKDCGKTRTMSKFALTDYFCFPDNSLFLISSTTLQGMQLRVWGDIKTLFARAKQRWPSCPGFPLESKYGIFTDELDENSNVRDMRKGIICIAMRDSQGQWVGMSQYGGLKQGRRRVMGDEVQYYAPSYLSIMANLDKGDFKGIFVGNPIGELDPLDKLAEPIDGWDSLGEISGTTTWRNRWDGVTIQLYGPDSPAIRYPGQFAYLTDQVDIDRITKRFGKDSIEYFQQGLGVRKSGDALRRVYTRDMALKFGSKEEAMWGPGETTKVYGLDAAYGGDRCVGVRLEFGKDINGEMIVEFGEPHVIPIVVYPRSVPMENRVLAEDQIAYAVMKECRENEIPPANVFFDATGRGSLGTSFARIWSAEVNPMEFGGAPTNRPVCNDLFIVDPRTGERRLKTAREHYVKFVTELWFAMRYAGEGRQLRSLPDTVIEEMSKREWSTASGGRYELESKDAYKKRYGVSPDFADAAVCALEGARRLGFKIASLENANKAVQDDRWKRQIEQRVKSFRRKYTLNYA